MFMKIWFLFKEYIPFGEYEEWHKTQEAIEQFEIEQIEIANKIENDKWFKAEQESIEQWRELQTKNELLLQKKLQQQAKLKLVSNFAYNHYIYIFLLLIICFIPLALVWFL